MEMTRKIARSVILGAALASCALTFAQEGKKGGGERRPEARHEAPRSEPRQERRAESPARREGPRPEAQRGPQAGPRQPAQPRQEGPGRNAGAMEHNVERNREPGGRGPQARPGGEPGRTFGNQPGRQQPAGRPAGNNARMNGRPSEPPTRPSMTKRGDVIHRDTHGQIRQVRLANGTRIYHPPNGPRRVEVVRPGNRVVVASAPGRGYIQRPVTIRNTTIVKRTYIFNGRPQVRLYRPRVYHGITLNVYTPVHYYRPAFYSWAYNPWPRPIVFSFGWASRPWYGYYGGYFTPYPSYASPALWLTDYLIASTLEYAYEERMAAAAAANYAPSGQAVAMTPEVKQAIADEVRRQIDQERAEGQSANAANGPDGGLFAGSGPHVFLVNTALAVNSNSGECSVSEGDVLQLNGAPPANSTYAALTVLSSRPGDCQKGTTVSVWLQDLQEMQNQMMATMDRGMNELQSQQGQGGLPALPAGAAGTIDSPYAQEAQPDSDAASELANVNQEADREEQQLNSEAGTPPTLSLGQTVDEVKAIQGEPQKVVDLGAKKIYVYKDLKITFTAGKVSDIQ